MSRQTIDRVHHPKRGPGALHYENGPASFVANDGTVTPLKSASMGGASSTRGSWRVAVDPEHGRVECPLVEAGDAHRRGWIASVGDCWIVWLAAKGQRWGGFRMRIEPDSGAAPWTVEVSMLCGGRPAYAAKVERSRGKLPHREPEDDHWQTWRLTTGEVMAVRDCAPAVAPVEPTPAMQGVLL